MGSAQGWAERRFFEFIDSRLSDVLAFVALGAAVKLFITRGVAVNGDTGLYLYDAQQILMGRVQFVDYPSRSPVFEHLIALAIWIGDSPLASARAFIFLVSLALGVAVYVFARQLHSHRAGLASMAIFYFTPFTLVWGAWVKTEQAAALTTLTAFIVALHVIDRERIPWWSVGVVGALFAMSYLIRRVAIVHIGAFALFVLWYRYRNDHRIELTLDAAIGVFITALATLLAAYFVLVRGNLELTGAVFEVHSLALFQSGGQGSLGWIHLTDPVAITATSHNSLLSYVCQKCGANTIEIFGKTALVTLPALGALLIFVRAGVRRLDNTGMIDYWIPLVVFVAVGWRLLRGVPDIAAVSLIAIATVTFAVWGSKPATLGEIWSDKLALPIIVFLALAAGYLYRDRILYTTYFQDFFPYVATVAGISLVAWLRHNRTVFMRVTFAFVLVLAALVAGIHADPYTPESDNINSYWFTTELVDAYGDDMAARLPDGGLVFTAQPLYVIESDARPLADLSRRYYLFRGWPDDPQTAELEDDIVAALESGQATYAIDDSNMVELTRESPRIRSALEEYYCAVDAPLYGETGGQLLVHESAGECA